MPASSKPLTEAALLKMPASAYMNREQLAFFRSRLEALRDEMLSNAADTGATLKENENFADPNDRATVEEEHMLEQRVRDRERKLLKKINSALNRIESGEYGWCLETGDPIGLPRLLARPTAEYSIEAQERHEKWKGCAPDPVRSRTMDAPQQADPLPITLLTGFLGSGKTTVLNHLVRTLPRTAILMNEFGEVALDHQLLQKMEGPMALLSGGCVCCTISGSLSPTLKNLWMARQRGDIPPFERVIIETTGIADPAPVLDNLLHDNWVRARFRLDGVVTTVDALFGMGQLDEHFEAVKQVAVADRLLLTKTDLAPAETVAALRERLAALNPAADLIRGDARRTRPGGDPEPRAVERRNPLARSRALAEAAALPAGCRRHARRQARRLARCPHPGVLGGARRAARPLRPAVGAVDADLVSRREPAALQGTGQSG
jgi:RNA polymerase-binding protein DksA